LQGYSVLQPQFFQQDCGLVDRAVTPDPVREINPGGFMNLRRQLPLLFPWFFVLAFFIQLVSFWGQLTGRLAVHFDAYGTPNGWAGKEVFALVALASLAGTAAVFTWCLQVSRRRGGTQITFLYPLYYGMVMFLSALFWQILWYNLQGREFNLGLSVWVGLAGAGLGYWVGRSRPEVRSAAASESAAGTGEENIIGIDVHREPVPFVALLAGLALMVFIYVYAGHGSPIAVRVLMGSVVVLIGYFTLLAGAGFSYVISRDSVQVRGLFRPIRTVSRKDILAVDIRHAPRFSGYGVRLWGEGTAYYLGGEQAVRLKMAQQSLFLGSNRPEYLLKLLEEMMADRKAVGGAS
jgi:hypothetical protein